MLYLNNNSIITSKLITRVKQWLCILFVFFLLQSSMHPLLFHQPTSYPSMVSWSYPFLLVPKRLFPKFALTLFYHTTSPDTFLSPFQPACTRLITSFSQSLLLWTVNTTSLSLSLLPVTLLFHLSPSHSHIHSVLLQLNFVPLLSRAYLHLPRFFYSFSCTQPLPQSTSSANNIVQIVSCPISSDNLSITIGNRKWLRADPWCRSYFLSSWTSFSYLQHTSPLPISTSSHSQIKACKTISQHLYT